MADFTRARPALVDDLRPVGPKKTRSPSQALVRSRMDAVTWGESFKIGDWSPSTSSQRIHLDVREPPGAVDRDERGQVVDFLAREAAPPGNAQRRHPAIGHARSIAEYLEVDVAHQVGQLDQLERHAQIRLVGTVKTHRVRVRESRKRVRQRLARDDTEDFSNQVLHERHDLGLAQKGRFDVDL
jgi:hypothetical protein